VLCCVDAASAYYVDNTMQCQKKEKVRRQWYGLTCTSDNKTDERCHRRRNRRKKIGMNTNLEFNYFVIIILNSSLYFQRVF
jgi:hypothetical protein